MDLASVLRHTREQLACLSSQAEKEQRVNNRHLFADDDPYSERSGLHSVNSQERD
jgi:hypothetical protein